MLPKARFIIASPKYCLKPLFKSLNAVFKTDTTVHRSKKREKVSKVKTVDDVPGEFVVCSYDIPFRYPNLHRLFKRKESKT